MAKIIGQNNKALSVNGKTFKAGIEEVSVTVMNGGEGSSLYAVDTEGTMHGTSSWQTLQTITMPKYGTMYCTQFSNEYEWSPADAVTLANSNIAIINKSCTVSYACFIAGTQIQLINGVSKNIEDITIGEAVLGYDGEYFTPVTVLNTFHHKYSGKLYTITTDDDSFTATYNHPMYVNGEYIQVKDLKNGDKLLCKGQPSEIKSITVQDVVDIDVYNLDVSDTNNYCANTFLTHNKPT